MPPSGLPALKIEAPPSTIPTAELAAGEHLRVNSDLAQTINLVGKVHPSLDRDTGNPAERAGLDENLQKAFVSLYAACDSKVAASQAVEAAKQMALKTKIGLAEADERTKWQESVRTGGGDPDKTPIPEDVQKRIDAIKESTQLTHDDLADIKAQDIIAEYFDESTGTYYQVEYEKNRDGSIQRDKDGKPVFKKDTDGRPAIKKDTEDNKTQVDLKGAFGALHSELEGISQLPLNSDGTPTADALQAERLLDTFVQTSDGNLKLFTKEEMAAVKTIRQEREAEKLAETIKKAQAVMFDEWGNIHFPDSDEPIGNPLLTTILRFATNIYPDNDHAGFAVNGALKMLQTRLARRLPPNNERVTTVNNLITVFKNIEGQPDAARNFAERLSGHVDLLKLTDEDMANLFNENSQLSDVINIIARAAKDRPEIPEQLEQALKTMVPDGTFDTKNIIEDLKKHEKYKEYIQSHPKEVFEGRAAEGNLFHEAKKRNFGDRLLIAAMFLMMGAQVLQGADQEAMAGASGDQGGGQPQ